MYKNHYDYLEKHFSDLLKNIGVKKPDMYCGIIVVDGDKASQYEGIWKDVGIPFYHGVAVYLLTKVKPYCDDVRNTPNGFVAPYQWVIDNYNKFKDYLPPVK